MLSFSKQQICFQYAKNTHLESSLTVKNQGQTHVYYKFKVNRPKVYLVKKDRGVIPPNSEIQISFTLHKEGVQQASADKFKCFSIKSDANPNEKSMEKFQERVGAIQHKFHVVLQNSPSELNGDPGRRVTSEVRSIANSKLTTTKKASTSYENIMKQKQERVSILKGEIETMQKSLRQRKIAQGPVEQESSWKNLLITGIIGLGIGIVSSLWV